MWVVILVSLCSIGPVSVSACTGLHRMGIYGWRREQLERDTPIGYLVQLWETRGNQGSYGPTDSGDVGAAA